MIRDDSADRNPNRLESVRRALLVIRMLNRRPFVTVSDVASELGVAPSTAHRLLSTLGDHGFTSLDYRHRYCAGPELTRQANTTAVPDVVGLVRPHLRALAAETGETVHSHVLLGRESRFVDGIEGGARRPVGLRTGLSVPAYCTSAGKAMLAQMRWEAVADLHRDGLPTWPRARTTTVDGLRSSLAAVRSAGHAMNQQETEAGVIAVGVSINDSAGAPLAGLSVAIPVTRFDRRGTARLVHTLTRVKDDAESSVLAAAKHRCDGPLSAP